MATELTGIAKEESTYVVNAAFTDEDGDAVVPASMVWSLTDKDASIVNSREDVAVTPLASSSDIVLSGDDLVVTADEITEALQDPNIGIDPILVDRFITFVGTYDSTLGNGLPLTGEFKFKIENYVNVP